MYGLVDIALKCPKNPTIEKKGGNMGEGYGKESGDKRKKEKRRKKIVRNV